jgi:aspartate/methionine/tyrosine aminotransferase
VFSSRVPSSLAQNPFSVALRQARAASRPLIDLTVSNPTRAGFAYPDDLLQRLTSADSLVYEPNPFGLFSAREAVAREYTRRGLTVAPERIVLTSSTSEAYSLLFKLLCEPSSDVVLAPTPSYPLFEHLTRLDGVTLVPYLLEYHGRWTLDVTSVEQAWTARTRAVLAVSPNNPTGSCLSREEQRALSAMCAARSAAFILDEVFADYPLTTDAEPPAMGYVDEGAQCLTFRLGGLSKSAGLPQVKLGWFTVEGPDSDVRDALARLEFICDAYLSVSTPVQVATPDLISRGRLLRDQIVDRVRGNYSRLRRMVASLPALELLAADGGWSAVLRVPARKSEEEVVLELLERDNVVVHPGFFFDFPREAFLVLSLLPPPPIFDDGISRIARRLAADVGTSASSHTR